MYFIWKNKNWMLVIKPTYWLTRKPQFSLDVNLLISCCPQSRDTKGCKRWWREGEQRLTISTLIVPTYEINSKNDWVYQNKEINIPKDKTMIIQRWTNQNKPFTTLSNQSAAVVAYVLWRQLLYSLDGTGWNDACEHSTKKAVEWHWLHLQVFPGPW